MLNRYIGNKKAILKPIIDHIKMNVPEGGRVCDAFSGSLAVSLELKKEGYVVSTNDINLFSHFYGKHLIEQCDIPDLDISLFDIFNINEYVDQAQSYIEKNLKKISKNSRCLFIFR
jgi:adenine-specific DNA-methyltransferase